MKGPMLCILLVHIGIFPAKTCRAIEVPAVSTPVPVDPVTGQPAVQTYRSQPGYFFKASAQAALRKFSAELEKLPGVNVISGGVDRDGMNYAFAVGFFSPLKLGVYRSEAVFHIKDHALKAMADRVKEFSGSGRLVIAKELTDQPGRMAYVITYLTSEAPRPAAAVATDKKLCACARNGDVKCALSAILSGADVNALDETHFRLTPLMFAALNGKPEVVRVLISRGARVDLKNSSAPADEPTTLKTRHTDKTALHYAAQAANINGNGIDKESPGHIEAAGLLIAAGADVNAQDRWGFTPIHLAAISNSYAIAQRLIQAGADLNLASYMAKRKPCGAARLHRNFEIAELLRKAGADCSESYPGF
ncbi:MAG: ankyrin repeat domain-containing protein [Elusimicrobiales bacterium]|nr:ankyrin repeat domain-containing protein [Elusimicrobiales bacterium]